MNVALMIRKFLFRLARSRFSAVFIGVAFAHFSWLMPLRRRTETVDFLIFRHPVPFWEQHWLAVPKHPVPNLLALDLNIEASQLMLLALLQGMQQVDEAQTILVNGGSYQDVPQLHFHLAAGMAKNGSQLGQEPIASPTQQPARRGTARAYPHPNPTRAFHWLLVSETAVSPFHQLSLNDPSIAHALLDLIHLAQQIIQQQQLSAYTLLLNPKQTPLTFHLLK